MFDPGVKFLASKTDALSLLPDASFLGFDRRGSEIPDVVGTLLGNAELSLGDLEVPLPQRESIVDLVAADLVVFLGYT